MKYRKSIIFALAISIILMMPGCADDFLDTAPTSSVSAPTISETLSGLYLAVNGIHRKMVSQDLGNQGMGGEPGFMLSRDAHGDDMTWDTQTWHRTHLTWAINTNPSSSYNDGVWRTYYQFILNANMILENLEANFADSQDPLASHIRGECLAIRGWAHFQLVQYYAKRYVAGGNNSQPGVPYREASEAVDMARHSVEEVYTFINRDLDEAITLLKGYKPADINHYTEKVVHGLKARVALAQQKYPEAAASAALAIQVAESEGHSLMTIDQLMNGFANITLDTKEAIYAALTLNDQTVYFYSFYAYMSWNFNSGSIRTGIKCISQSTYDLMSETDERRQWWDPTGTADTPAANYNKRAYQNRKFTARSPADPVGDIAFMRLAEMYLVAAEAYARAGQNENAKTYLNEFLQNRDPEYVDLGNTGDMLAEEVMTHRRIELWGEGFRWFDLKRLNLPVNRTGNNFNITFCGFLQRSHSEEGWYYEIPKNETDFNTLMEKNY